LALVCPSSIRRDEVAYFEDLSPCSHFGRWAESLLAVGWLESGREFTKGSVGKDVFSILVRLCVKPWQPMVPAGRHPCSFCRFTMGPAQLVYEDASVALGNANVFLPGSQKILVAPTMLLHYIDAHGYAPPQEFLEAAVRCPAMNSLEYLRQMKARGLVP
jgi:hypothetical protein